MAKEKSDEDLKLYYSIGEVAERLGVKTSQLRFWETEFAHIKPNKNSRGDRRFTKDNIRQLEEIQYLLKDRGFTIEGARKEIAAGKKQAPERQQIIDHLRNVRARLVQLRDDLE
jgi:DNA-binding transcriptional MerR regulator